MWRVSKDGETFHEIEADYDEATGVDRSLEAAKAKGYKPFQQVTKDGKDVFDIEATEDSLKAAYDKGYKDVDMQKFIGDAGKPNVGDSAFSSLISGFAQGYDDEFGGALEAAGSTVGLRGVGSSNLGDIRLETDEEDKESLGDIYRGARDVRREDKAEAQAANPGVYLAGDILGSVATGGAIPGAATLKGGAVIGGVQGLGRSEADLTEPSLENYGQAVVDTAGGVAAGVAGYGLGKGIEKGVSAVGKVPDMFRAGMDYLKTVGRGAKRGAKEAGEDLPILGIQQIAAGAGALKGAVKELIEVNAASKELVGIAKEARDILAKNVQGGGLKINALQSLKVIGNGKKLVEFSDDEAIVGALLAEGENPVKRWFAQKAATSYPGQIDADEYSKILGLGSPARTAAREFNPRDAAKALKGNVEEVQNLFKNARSERFKELQEAAKANFDEGQAASVLGNVDEAIADVDLLKSIPGSVKGVLEDVKGMLTNGQGIRSQKLTPGTWREVSRGERFHRLQQARKLLDKKLKWTQNEGLSHAEEMLRDVRRNIDDALKTSPDKVEADALYRASKDVEGKFFGATEFRNKAGGIDVDESKLARLLGDTDQANRFKASMEELRAFSEHPDLSPAFKDQAKNLIADLEQNIGVADTKRALGAFRFKNGPSSPSVERLGSAAKGNTLLQDMVQSPAGGVNQLDQFNKMLTDRLGKGFDALNPQERTAAVKFIVWMKKNPDANQTTADNVWNRLFGAN